MQGLVVSYLVSTSNHNLLLSLIQEERLFLILYLHQTTTNGTCLLQRNCCFLSCIYIKPQHNLATKEDVSVVSYLVSTSNHNNLTNLVNTYGLFLILYLHQTTTVQASLSSFKGCFLSCIYIKPQLNSVNGTANIVVSYLVSTSNHNAIAIYPSYPLLFLILYLHQTTTNTKHRRV